MESAVLVCELIDRECVISPHAYTPFQQTDADCTYMFEEVSPFISQNLFKISRFTRCGIHDAKIYNCIELVDRQLVVSG